MATLGAAIVGVIVVNAFFSFWQQYRAERALEALEQLLPPRVLALRDGEPTELDARRLVPGDLILLAVYSPWGQSLLGTASLGAQVWLLFVPLAVTMLGLEELRKFFARRRVSRLAHSG